MKLDILAIGSHPDDVELACSGTLLWQAAEGKKTGIVDLTQGELGSNGTIATRKWEAKQAAKILGLSARENLQLPDGFFQNGKEEQLAVIRVIRRYQPEMILAPAPSDRHPDHGRGADLVRDAVFYSGLAKVETHDEHGAQQPWRPKILLHFIQNNYLTPDFLVDITPYWAQKVEAIMAYHTQFYNPNQADQVTTHIAEPRFLQFLEARAREYGNAIGQTYAEAFIKGRPIQIHDLWTISQRI